jgi:autotransporter strand-loop-strand O-heptosyltransferase
MRIAQITPGVIPIPPNGWGAVEKIIWEYTKVLRSLGHHVEILYTDDVKPGEWDVVHVHMANLALLLKERGISYVFSHHDHHAFHYGKESEVYHKNKEAIEGSVFSFVHAKYLVDYFNVPGKIRYLGHGANLEDYAFSDRSHDVLVNGPKLVMMANNGLAGDPSYDRKGFGPGIEAARLLKAPITIICRSEGNKSIIEKFASYELLDVRYDLDYRESIDEMKKSSIFLNPSMLEAGHPNLTVTEAISMGIPVIGTAETRISGTYVVPLIDLKVNPEDLQKGIEEITRSYSSYVLECKDQRELLSWEVVVSRMVMDYNKYCRISQKKSLLDNYQAIKIRTQDQDQQPGYYHRFRHGPHLYKAKRTESDVSVALIDKRTGEVFHKLAIGPGPRSWISPYDPVNRYIDWRIEVREGHKIVYEAEVNLKNQHVLIKNSGGLSSEDLNIIFKFSKENGCYITLDSLQTDNRFFSTSSPEEDLFYRALNIDQIKDFFKSVEKAPRKLLIKFLPGALGDNIAFMPYVNELGKLRGEKIYVIAKHRDLFEGVYENIEFVEDSDCTEYWLINFIFGRNLQEGFSYQLGLDHKEIRPKIRKFQKPTENKIKGKYVCFSTHSTCQAKFWNNNNAWSKLCDMLKEKKITPVCIDRFDNFGIEGHWNRIPDNCLKMTGGDLDHMMNLIEGCEFFIGLSSGLSWVAHAMGKRVVMISGVTPPENEFSEDCLRIHRDDVCNSCFNNSEEHKFNPGNWLWCPVHEGTPRQFECTKKISAKQVMDRMQESGWI